MVANNVGFSKLQPSTRHLNAVLVAKIGVKTPKFIKSCK